MTELEIPIIYSRIISSMAARTPAALREVLRGTGLDQNLGKSLGGYMSIAQYKQLLRNASSVSGDPLIALKAGTHIPLSVHGPLSIAVTSSQTLGIGLKTLAHYTKLRSPFCGIRLKQDAGNMLLLFNMQSVLGDQSEAALDFILANIGHSLPNFGCKLPVAIKLELSRPEPANARQYQQLLGCDVAFNQSRNAFVFDIEDMDIELLGANEKAFAQSVDQLRRISSSLNLSDTTEDAVLNVFIKNTGHLCTLENVAQIMLTTPRTLQRRLRAEALSFQSLRDNWLSQQARNHLEQDGLSVEVTATLLGYSDTANFRRSFKRWFGLPPRHLSKK